MFYSIRLIQWKCFAFNAVKTIKIQCENNEFLFLLFFCVEWRNENTIEWNDVSKRMKLMWNMANTSARVTQEKKMATANDS